MLCLFIQFQLQLRGVRGEGRAGERKPEVWRSSTYWDMAAGGETSSPASFVFGSLVSCQHSGLAPLNCELGRRCLLICIAAASARAYCPALPCPVQPCPAQSCTLPRYLPETKFERSKKGKRRRRTAWVGAKEAEVGVGEGEGDKAGAAAALLGSH